MATLLEFRRVLFRSIRWRRPRRMMNPRISAVAGAALVALTLAGCSAQEAPERAADDEQHLNTGESQTTEEPTEQPADEPEPSQPARGGESLRSEERREGKE